MLLSHKWSQSGSKFVSASKQPLLNLLNMSWMRIPIENITANTYHLTNSLVHNYHQDGLFWPYIFRMPWNDSDFFLLAVSPVHPAGYIVFRQNTMWTCWEHLLLWKAVIICHFWFLHLSPLLHITLHTTHILDLHNNCTSNGHASVFFLFCAHMHMTKLNAFLYLLTIRISTSPGSVDLPSWKI